MMSAAGVAQDPSHGAGERGELVHMSSKDIPGSPDPSELGSPRSAPCFDLLKMVVSYKRMTLFLEPVTDTVELTRFLLGCVYIFFICITLGRPTNANPTCNESNVRKKKKKAKKFSSS